MVIGEKQYKSLEPTRKTPERGLGGLTAKHIEWRLELGDDPFADFEWRKDPEKFKCGCLRLMGTLENILKVFQMISLSYTMRTDLAGIG